MIVVSARHAVFGAVPRAEVVILGGRCRRAGVVIVVSAPPAAFAAVLRAGAVIMGWGW
ncbi:hypothetical protein [Pseudonocardia pini]|uniref:hypothetical protein n=1 Tax=Pseudonocardia pini TaxID=2758030 RepID=UPI0015F0673F|nr:hypothetical protein [Pseudonocardia pini]